MYVCTSFACDDETIAQMCVLTREEFIRNAHAPRSRTPSHSSFISCRYAHIYGKRKRIEVEVGKRRTQDKTFRFYTCGGREQRPGTGNWEGGDRERRVLTSLARNFLMSF